MTLGNRIANYRKRMGITQDALAQQLEVTNQAVSKWESDQCCPDIQLLPRLADIFGITIDELFGRESATQNTVEIHDLPWPNDGDLRGVLYIGRQLVGHMTSSSGNQLEYHGNVRNVSCDFSVVCENVLGNINAAGNVICGDVDGHINTRATVACGKVHGDVDAGGTVQCGDVGGNVNTASDVRCGDVGYHVKAGSDVV